MSAHDVSEVSLKTQLQHVSVPNSDTVVSNDIYTETKKSQTQLQYEAFINQD